MHALRVKMKEKKVYFNNKHGEKLCGILTVPEDSSRRYPLVILCHGFSSSKDSKIYSFMSQKLYEKRILSLRLDFYGHGESEGKFEDVTITEGCNDVLSAVNFVEKLGYISKIMVYGVSFGGVCALLAASRSKDIIALGLRAPASDMIEVRRIKLGEEGLNEWKKKRYSLYKNYKGKELRLNYTFAQDAERINTFEEARNIDIPVLIIHGDKDASVPLAQSEKLSRMIRKSTLKIIKGADHFFERPGEKEKTSMIFIEFFKEVLK